MFDLDRRLLMLRRLAWVCAALVLAITSLSAFIRLSRAGLGCQPWPACYAQAVDGAEAGARAAPPAGTAAARAAHRVSAMAALAVILVMGATALGGLPALWPQARLVLALLALAIFLAVLGRWSAGTPAPWVTLGNLLAGFGMFALCWRLAARSARPGRHGPRAGAVPRGLAAAAGVAAALLLLQIGLGAWGGADPGAADPPLNGLHRATGLLTGMALLGVGAWAWWNSGRHAGLGRLGASVMLLVGLQVTLGLWLVAGGLPLAVALAHNILANLLLATLAALAGQALAARRWPERGPTR